MWLKFWNWLKGSPSVSNLVYVTLNGLVSQTLIDALQQLILDVEDPTLSGQAKKQAVITKVTAMRGIIGDNARALPAKLLSIAINGLVYQLQLQGKL